MIYCVTAQVERKVKGAIISGQVPTFFLDDRIQGIMGVDHAKFIAAEIINPFRLKGIKLHIDIVESAAVPS